jgi:phospholipid/cholesterol/gamma-HCH transport system substrate-binding protein
MSKLRAGILALAVIGLFAYFGFTKANPFSNPYQLNAVFNNVNNLKPKSPVRIAGVEVGKVKKVEPVTSGDGAARVTMELKKKALPLHQDAEAHVRSRIFLEGNFFVDIQPGSPSAPTMKDGGTIPIQRTSAPVQLGQVLSALQNDTREDLKVFLKEYSKGLSGKGARGFNQSIRYWTPAYKNAALANDATLGVDPTRDVQRVLKGQQRTFKALDEEPQKLKSLVTDFNSTAGAFASQDVALEAAIPALRDTLETAQPALASLNNALPTLRVFSKEALPGVRSSGPTLDASLPFIHQARLLVRPEELRGTAATLRKYIPSLVRLNARSVPLSSEARQLSACTNKVLVPYQHTKIPDVDDHANTDQEVRYQLQRGFPGLSGESRLSDGNNQSFHGSGVPNPVKVQPAPPTVIDQPPPRRPDIPCETQQTPDLHAPKASVATSGLGGLIPFTPSLPLPRFKSAPLMKAGQLLKKDEQKQNAKFNAKAVKALEKKGKTKQAEALAKKVGLR